MAFTQWKELEVRIRLGETIDKKEQTIVKEKVEGRSYEIGGYYQISGQTQFGLQRSS